MSDGPKPVASGRALERAARWVVWALRHEPQEAGIEVDREGFALVSDLIKAARSFKHVLNVQAVEDIVAADSKQRLEYSANHLKLRAAQGHSFEVDLSAQRAEPPELLFHGTATHVIDAIRRDGLRAQRRQYVHLSHELETATKVGSRHGTPVILPIRASEMARNGAVFLRASNGVWLVEEVPPSAIDWENLVWPGT